MHFYLLLICCCHLANMTTVVCNRLVSSYRVMICNTYFVVFTGIYIKWGGSKREREREIERERVREGEREGARYMLGWLCNIWKLQI